MTTTTPPDAPDRSYRALCIAMLCSASTNSLLHGHAEAAKGNFEDARQLALDSYELLRAIDWAKSLPAELCPPITMATFEELKAEAMARATNYTKPKGNTQ